MHKILTAAMAFLAVVLTAGAGDPVRYVPQEVPVTGYLSLTRMAGNPQAEAIGVMILGDRDWRAELLEALLPGSTGDAELTGEVFFFKPSLDGAATAGVIYSENPEIIGRIFRNEQTGWAEDSLGGKPAMWRTMNGASLVKVVIDANTLLLAGGVDDAAIEKILAGGGGSEFLTACREKSILACRLVKTPAMPADPAAPPWEDFAFGIEVNGDDLDAKLSISFADAAGAGQGVVEVRQQLPMMVSGMGRRYPMLLELAEAMQIEQDDTRVTVSIPGAGSRFLAAAEKMRNDTGR